MLYSCGGLPQGPYILEFQVIFVFQGVSTRLSFDEEPGALLAALGIPPNDLPKSPRGGTDVVA